MSPRAPDCNGESYEHAHPLPAVSPVLSAKAYITGLRDAAALVEQLAERRLEREHRTNITDPAAHALVGAVAHLRGVARALEAGASPLLAEP